MPSLAEEKAAAKRNAAVKAQKEREKQAKLAAWEAARVKIEAERAQKEQLRKQREEEARMRNAAAARFKLADPITQTTLVQRALALGARAELPTATRYVITAAQNNTPVHRPFLNSLLTYCKCNKAELVVIPYRYRNPTSPSEENKQEETIWWAPELVKYLFAGRESVNRNLGIMGDLMMQPTRSSPLSGLDALSYSSSSIFGHPKVELKTVPTPGHRLPKILTTTGAVTLPNFSDSVTGKIAEFHHSQAAIVVEVSGDKFFLRQVYGDKLSGEFTDLAYHYTPKGKQRAEAALALVLGDQHVGFCDPGVEKATFARGGMLETLKPKHLVFHDLLDGYSCNPHHAGDPFRQVVKQSKEIGDVRKEVERACAYVKERTPKGTVPVVVSSNHDDFLRRWIHSADWKTQGVNANFYLQTASMMLAGTKEVPAGVETPAPFAMWMDRLLPEAKQVGSESFSLAGVELSLHGDRGPNGSRGSIKNLRRIGSKIIIGHSHSPGINEGAFQTGTSSLLKLEYNSGPSSWAHAHCVLYATGKRSLLFIVDGDWKL